jgi:hypothetical protein
MRRISRRQKPDPIEPALFPASLGQEQMTEMDRIERSAEQTESHAEGFSLFFRFAFEVPFESPTLGNCKQPPN